VRGETHLHFPGQSFYLFLLADTPFYTESDLDVSAVRRNLRMEDDLAGLFEFADFDDVIRQKSYCDVRRKG
jgi:hypothetical protein